MRLADMDGYHEKSHIHIKARGLILLVKQLFFCFLSFFFFFAGERCQILAWETNTGLLIEEISY